MPDGQTVALPNLDTEIITRSQRDAKQKGNSLAGIISRIIMPGFGFRSAGEMKVEVAINGETHLAGALNVNLLQPNVPAQLSTVQ